MGKFKVELDGRKFEYEGTPEEFCKFLELMGIGKPRTTAIQVAPRRVNGLPSSREIAEYIKAKEGNMEH
ncbi:MAG: hypothetical protein ACUVTB_07785, partial [Candidatus Bathycorpusculaceae bacterium]